MKLTYGELEMSLSSLAALMDREDIPFETALKISKNSMTINEHMAHYTHEKQKLIEKYGQRDPETEELIIEQLPDGRGKYVIKEDKIDECNEKLDALMRFEVDIDIRPIYTEELKSIRISPNSVSGIMYMIKDNKED